MTYIADEQAGLPPIELFKFGMGASTWLYTSGDTTITFNSEVYVPAIITREATGDSSELSSAEITIEVQRDLAVVAQFVGKNTPSPVWLTLYRIHRGDLVNSGMLFTGEVSDIEWRGSMASMKVQALQQQMERPVPRMIYQASCNNFLYDQRCLVNPATYEVSGTISAITTNADGRQVLTVAAAAAASPNIGTFRASAAYYTGGVVLIGNERGFIEQQNVSDLKMMHPMAGAVVSAAVKIYPGCDRRNSTCYSKFNNIVHFAGFPYIPKENPFDKTTNPPPRPSDFPSIF